MFTKRLVGQGGQLRRRWASKSSSGVHELGSLKQSWPQVPPADGRGPGRPREELRPGLPVRRLAPVGVLSEVRTAGGARADPDLTLALAGLQVPGFVWGSACLLGEEHFLFESMLTVLRT